MLNVFDIAQPEERKGDRLASELPEDAPNTPNEYLWFSVDPEALYPQALAHVATVIEKGQRPPDPLGLYYDRAKALEPVAWEHAHLDRAAMNDPIALGLRREALELARLWFTEMLHQAAGQPIAIHILKSDRWKL